MRSLTAAADLGLVRCCDRARETTLAQDRDTRAADGVGHRMDAGGSVIHAVWRRLGAVARHPVIAGRGRRPHLPRSDTPPEVASRGLRRCAFAGIAADRYHLHDADFEGQPVIAPTSNQSMKLTAGSLAINF